jgi:hypothetical protein
MTHGRELVKFEGALLAPIKKLRHRVGVCRTRIFISDVGGEELDEPPGDGEKLSSHRSFYLLVRG